MKRFLTICFIILSFASQAFAKPQWYNAKDFIGGCTSCLDSINGILLSNGYVAFVVKSSGQTSMYILDSDSGLSEDSTNYRVISPDLNAGTKRWIKTWQGGRILIPDSTIDQGDSSVTGTLAWHISNASGNATTVTILPGTYTISQNITVPATMTLKFEQGGILADDASNADLAINGPITAGQYQILNWGNGSGTLTLGAFVSTAYPEWMGAVDGTADEVQINSVIAAMTSGTVFLSDSYTTAATINLKTKVNFRGLAGGGGNGTVITYSGSGSAIKGSGIWNSLISDLNVVTTHDDASGIELGTASRRLNVERFYAQGTNAAATTGAGILLAAGTGWSGGLGIKDCYILGYKYGVKMTGTHLSTGTWTTVDMTNLWLVGRNAGIIADSAGIYMDALTNGIGTYLRGGTIEYFVNGIEHIPGGVGGDFVADFEGNTSNYSVGATFNGLIKIPSPLNFFRQAANGLTNKWYLERHLSGQYVRETYYDQKHVVLYGGGGARIWGVYAGDPGFIDGGEPYPQGGFYAHPGYHTPGATPQSYGLFILDRRISYGTAAPTGGTWAQGSVVLKSNSGAGDSLGWRCNHSGTFGSATDSTGDTDGSTAVITGMADTSDFAVGDFVDVSAGFATTGPYKILELTSTTITLETNSDSAENNITVDTSNPTFDVMVAAGLNSGTGSIVSGATTDVITHGLSFTPNAQDIMVTLKENPTNTPGAIWVDSINGTNFTVNCETDPGASDLDFGWRVIR